MPELELTQGIVEEWVRGTTGWFEARQIDIDKGIVSRKDKNTRAVALYRLREKGIIKAHPTRNGIFRLVQNEFVPIDWENADVNATLNLHYPFGLERLVDTYPKNVVVLAGSKSSGKTAFCLDFIRLNMLLYDIIYLTSEMGKEELKRRINAFKNVPKWNFEAYERRANFADVIAQAPNKIYVIDYLQMTDNFYLVAKEIDDIWDASKGGMALIALQKSYNAKLGRGAEFSIEKARLYLTLDLVKNGRILKIFDAKLPAQEGINPTGMAWKFNLKRGCEFTNIQEITEDI